jgi:hypothetical protein
LKNDFPTEVFVPQFEETQFEQAQFEQNDSYQGFALAMPHSA